MELNALTNNGTDEKNPYNFDYHFEKSLKKRMGQEEVDETDSEDDDYIIINENEKKN
jgi:hypothetical protein